MALGIKGEGSWTLRCNVRASSHAGCSEDIMGRDGRLLLSPERLDAVWWLVSPGNPLKQRQPAPQAMMSREVV